MNLSVRAYILLGIILAAVAGLGVFVFISSRGGKQSEAKNDVKPTQREGKGVRFKRPEDAKMRGINAQPVKAVQWKPRLFVNGRVIPNPNAIVEVRAPFAGIVRVESVESKLRLGATVVPLETLAMFDARFTPSEGLDLMTKLVDAEGRLQGAEEVLKLRQEKLTRLEKLPTGLLPQDEFDAASVQLVEARTQKNVSLTQVRIWKQALETVGKKTVIVPLQSPMAGEITEIGVQPGVNVDAGQVIIRIVDFRRVLLRLDFPPSSTAVRPAASVFVRSLDAPALWRAVLRGRAQSLEPGLQRASWLYEIMPDDKNTSPRWQAGLYVRAVLEDDNKPAVAAIAVPSSALLVHQGRTLVYIEKRLGRYERREVEILGRSGEFTFVAAESWLADVDRAVTTGAQILLSEEFRSDMDED